MERFIVWMVGFFTGVGIAMLVVIFVYSMISNSITNEEVVEIYTANEKEISALWLEMTEQGVDTSMRGAVEEWQRINGDTK